LPVIRTHDFTLYGGNDQSIVLRPLSDEHLPLLYRWNADPEVLYWTEGGEDVARSYDAETVHKIYGGVSQNAYCFLVEVDGRPIGECWLQKMNLPDVISMYPGLDVRRIDMAIGEKDCWGKGIGTAFVRMLLDFAFTVQNVDVLHCLAEDYNVRSQRIWQKTGFSLVRSDELQQSQKGKWQYHFALTKEVYIQSRRKIIPQESRVYLPLLSLQPSQLYISGAKLRLAAEWFAQGGVAQMDAIPVRLFRGRHLMTDGHTRAVLAYQAGLTQVPCYWDADDLDLKAYAIDMQWCEEQGISSVADLASRIVSAQQYEELWRRRCMEML
jgi:RimJ/RimL family protein N-acetyltransferase